LPLGLIEPERSELLSALRSGPGAKERGVKQSQLRSSSERSRRGLVCGSERHACFCERSTRGALKPHGPRDLSAHGRGREAHALRYRDHALIDSIAREAGATELHRRDAPIGLNQPTDRHGAWTPSRLEVSQSLTGEKLGLVSSYRRSYPRRAEIGELRLGLGAHEHGGDAGSVGAPRGWSAFERCSRRCGMTNVVLARDFGTRSVARLGLRRAGG
jgi:hypothetical protein